MPKEYPRTARINAELQRELAMLIRQELADPRVAGVSVTSADISPDLKNAKIMVSVIGSDEQLAEAVKGLNHAAGKLRFGVAKGLKLRVTPNLRFVPDTALREGDRIGAMLKKALGEDRANAREREK